MYAPSVHFSLDLKNAKEWTANGAISLLKRNSVYYVSLAASVKRILLPGIERGDYMMLYGPRASSKSTHIEEAIDILEQNDYTCLKYVFEQSTYLARIDFQRLIFDDLDSSCHSSQVRVKSSMGENFG